ncbi:hypothetical protein PR202_gb20805 [Eleusine coracana subsp. coracana]|uniref:Mitochondrial splicing suppressor 51-like C-terminal domain-containing protein n=1 Tax=Eleusine coracana subsp. coracana TaxID=191504 RepID=A0AAV5FBM5_ELECO|nr:hypothetical protein PR202_gb20805 [Eleusine coracana subsp. coracana]
MECAARGLATDLCADGAHRRCGSCGAVAYCSRAHQVSPKILFSLHELQQWCYRARRILRNAKRSRVDRSAEAATNYISLPSTISLPNLKVKLGYPVHSLFRDGEVVSISRYANCCDESCCCKSSTGSEDLNCSAVTLRLWKGFYHERYSDIMKDSNPHLIFAPNAGVAAYSSWMPTIELIRGTGIPAFFTDFCEEAAHLASGCISSITGQPLRVPVSVIYHLPLSKKKILL